MYEFQRWPTPQEAGITDADLIDLWEERVAICRFDGGLPEQEARRIAWEQIMGRVAKTRKEEMGGGRQP